MNIVLATRNPSKAVQITAMIKIPNVTILTLDDIGITGDAIEDGTTLEENARKKIQFVRDNGGDHYWILAEDTGLFISALGGRPGIHAARWAGNDATTDEITRFTLDQLREKNDRTATFRTVAILSSPRGEEFQFDGEVSGKILESPRMKPQPKMPYSAIFVPDGSSKVWAEMSTDEENIISHRGKAFKKVSEHLKNLVK